MVAKTPDTHIHFSQRGDGPPAILLHGLFGAGGNLGALARVLADSYSVYSLDLPNHGRSGWMDQVSLARMAAAVRDWMQSQFIADAILIGHSLGGKVAMELALTEPERVAVLVVADIAPVEYPAHHDDVLAALRAVQQRQCRSRAEAAEAMSEHLQEEGVIQFLLASLSRNPAGVYDWRFNLTGIQRDYAALRAAPGPGTAYVGPVLFVKGGASDYILPQHREQVLRLFPEAALKVMPGCGHWLHAEQPSRFNAIVQRFLARLRSGSQ